MLEPHRQSWSEEFAALRAVYQEALGPLAMRIEHIGSTAVPDLLAKPILDLDIVISRVELLSALIPALARLGYSYHGDQGIPEREVFKPADEFTPYVSPPRQWMKHHLYVCAADSAELQRHLRLRDALRQSAGLRRRYERLKLSVVAPSGGDRRLYAKLKAEAGREFFAEILSPSESS